MKSAKDWFNEWANQSDDGRFIHLKNMFIEIQLDALEAASKECIETWKNATNERTDSVFTSFRRNAVQEGCRESANAIQKLAEKVRCHD